MLRAMHITVQRARNMHATAKSCKLHIAHNAQCAIVCCALRAMFNCSAVVSSITVKGRDS
jgi:hypothetical protein